MKKQTIWIFILTAGIQNLCKAQAGCADSVNLVSNPQFDSGNNGFSSTLGYGVNCYPGYYYVGTSMQSKCYIWPASFVDHTSGTGNFLIVDGNDTYGPQDIWSENIQVLLNKTYTFSFWAKNLYTQQPFSLGIMIGGNQVSTTPLITAGAWSQYSTTWTAPSTAIVPIAIRQLTAGAYRDLGIDDIFMGYCKKELTGIEPQKGSGSALNIFPNPGHSEFTVSGFNLPISLVIYNAVGEKMLNLHLTSENFKLNLAAGIYFMEISSDGKRVTQKIIVE